MKTYAICPISDKKINERVARTNAVFTVLVLAGFTVTLNLFLILFLLVDFMLRSTSYSKISLIGIVSRSIVKYLPYNDHFINAGPKIFAARIGLIFSFLILLSLLFGAHVLVHSLSFILGVFSFLEAVFGICVACEIYPWVYKMFYHKKFK